MKFIQFIRNFINKEAFYKIVSKYFDFSRFNRLKFDKKTNVNKYRKRNSLDIIQENPISCIINNISHFNNTNNAKENFSRRSLENSVESNKNKTQITFVCNNDQNLDDKSYDLQYYLMQGTKSISQLNSIESPNRKNINLPLSTDNHYFTAGKMKSSTPNVKNAKFVTPKFNVKESDNNSSKKKLGVASKIKNSNCKYNNNNVENSSFSRTASMTKLNNNKNYNNNLPFNNYLPMQSPKIDNNNSNDALPKDDSIRLNSFNLSGGNNLINNINNSGEINSINNIKNFVKSHSKNYFKEIVESFNEKTLTNKSNLDVNQNNNLTNNSIIPKNYLNKINILNSANNFYHSDGKISSTINYVEGNEINMLLNSFSEKLNFETNSENLNYLKYRRNKNNSINFTENNLMKSMGSRPASNSKAKKSKSHSIHNFPVSDETLNSKLNYEYNFPLNQKSLNSKNEIKNKSVKVDIPNEVIKEELSSPTNNTEKNITIPNRIVVYSSYNKETGNNSKGNSLINSKNNNFNSRIFTSSENDSNQDLKNPENFNLNTNKNDKEFGNDNFSPRSIYSSKYNDKPIEKDNVDINNIVNKINLSSNVSQTKINKINKNILYSKEHKNLKTLKSDSKINSLSISNGLSSLRNTNFSELQSLNYQNNLIYFLNVLNNQLLYNKVLAFNSIISFTQQQVRLNKRYALKMIFRILKKRLVFLKLKFFTRGKVIKFI